MKRIIGLVVAVLVMLALTPVACGGGDFTLEFGRDFDTEETYSEVVLGLNPEPFSITLTWNHNFLPEEGNTVEMESGLKLGPIELGYTRELTVEDPGTLTATLTKDPFTVVYEKELVIEDPGGLTVTLDISPFTIEYEREFVQDAKGKITATFSKSF